MAKFEQFLTQSAVESKVACQLAKEWKSAPLATRKAACKRQGDHFTVSIIGSKSVFIFKIDGTVQTVNQPTTRVAPKMKKVEVDWNRNIIAWVGNRPVYA